jgi:hypothetical protein
LTPSRARTYIPDVRGSGGLIALQGLRNDTLGMSPCLMVGAFLFLLGVVRAFTGHGRGQSFLDLAQGVGPSKYETLHLGEDRYA